MAVWVKVDRIYTRTTHMANHQVDYSWEEFDPNAQQSMTEGQDIIIDERIELEGDDGFNLFAGANSVSGLELIDTSNATSFYHMFDGCRMSEIDLSSWDVSNVTNFTNMFVASYNLATVNLIGWDVSNVTECGGMFAECNHLTNILLEIGTNWQEEMIYLSDGGSGMFDNCIHLPGFNDYVTDIYKANNTGNDYGSGYFMGVWVWHKHDVYIKEYEV